MQMIPGKFYVLDIYASERDEPVLGPFDTKAEAEHDRDQLNIAEDCIVRRYVGRTTEA